MFIHEKLGGPNKETVAEERELARKENIRVSFAVYFE